MLDVKPGSSPGAIVSTMQMLDAIAGSSPVAMVSSRGKYSRREPGRVAEAALDRFDYMVFCLDTFTVLLRIIIDPVNFKQLAP